LKTRTRTPAPLARQVPRGNELAGAASSRTQPAPPGLERDQRACSHIPARPPADASARAAARIIACYPQQGWSLLCNGIVLFDDEGILPPWPDRASHVRSRAGGSDTASTPAPRRVAAALAELLDPGAISPVTRG